MPIVILPESDASIVAVVTLFLTSVLLIHDGYPNTSHRSYVSHRHDHLRHGVGGNTLSFGAVRDPLNRHNRFQ
jgi:hypothetical protein